MSAVADFVYPATRGQRPPGFERTLRFQSALHRIAARDPAVLKLVVEVQNLLRPQSAIHGDPELTRRVAAEMEAQKVRFMDGAKEKGFDEKKAAAAISRGATKGRATASSKDPKKTAKAAAAKSSKNKRSSMPNKTAKTAAKATGSKATASKTVSHKPAAKAVATKAPVKAPVAAKPVVATAAIATTSTAPMASASAKPAAQ